MISQIKHLEIFTPSTGIFFSKKTNYLYYIPKSIDSFLFLVFCVSSYFTSITSFWLSLCISKLFFVSFSIDLWISFNSVCDFHTNSAFLDLKNIKTYSRYCSSQFNQLNFPFYSGRKVKCSSSLFYWLFSCKVFGWRYQNEG